MPSADGVHVLFGMFLNRETDTPMNIRTNIYCQALAAVRIVLWVSHALCIESVISFVSVPCDGVKDDSFMQTQKWARERFKDPRKFYTFITDWIHWLHSLVLFLHIRLLIQFWGLSSVNKPLGSFCISLAKSIYVLWLLFCFYCAKCCK